ncbi:hypothetical protein FA15DRAFT_755123 [Coprinopsis marcescibilis]|uniref:F-box domain-containing protein n=1 Tax=Coprinopsis marcescibilis TaxID=230819 RepID=A0A5C3L002_COPMA|nr:hypothetical protein FA15DRAFT_755123 [Coprinopsis marcescibilis]
MDTKSPNLSEDEGNGDDLDAELLKFGDTEEQMVSLRQFSHMYLVLYDYEEFKAKQSYLRLRYDSEPQVGRIVVITDENLKYAEGRCMLEGHQWRLKRIVDMLTGFIEGDLDLTGRHASRWDAYKLEVSEFVLDAQKAIPALQTEPVLMFDGASFVLAQPESGQRQSLDDFRRKWKVPGELVEDLTQWIASIAHTNASKGLPKIQELCFSDLPVELVDSVFRECSLKEARTLSITSSRFYRIGQGYTTKSRDMSLEIPFAIYRDPAYSADTEDGREKLFALIETLKSQFSEYGQLLLSRPDLSSATRSLKFHFSLPDNSYRKWPQDVDEYMRSALMPACGMFTRVLAKSSNLTNLSVSKYVFELPSLEAICNMPNLGAMLIQNCTIADDVVELLAGGFHHLPPSHVANITLRISQAPDLDDMDQPQVASSWYFLCLCPYLRTLSVNGNIGTFQSRDSLFLPARDVLLEQFGFIRSVERLVLTGMSMFGLLQFADFINDAVGRVPAPALGVRPSLKLSHLKISSYYPASRPVYNRVIENLGVAARRSLRVLVIQGLSKRAVRDVRFFEHIARHLPDLHGLTIELSVSIKKRNEGVRWPLPSSEYAPALAGFTSLKYFGWNWPAFKFDYSPCSLEDLERSSELEAEGFNISKLDCLDMTPSWIDHPRAQFDEETKTMYHKLKGRGVSLRLWTDFLGGELSRADRFFGFMNDGYTDVLPLVVHCPTLETVCMAPSSKCMVNDLYHILPIDYASLSDGDDENPECGHELLPTRHAPDCRNPSEDCFPNANFVKGALPRASYISRTGRFAIWSIWEVDQWCGEAWKSVYQQWNTQRPKSNWPDLPMLDGKANVLSGI